MRGLEYTLFGLSLGRKHGNAFFLTWLRYYFGVQELKLPPAARIIITQSLCNMPRLNSHSINYEIPSILFI